MGYTAKIRGRYWRPLGTVEHVRQEIERVFPDAVFYVQEDPKHFSSKADRFRAMSQIAVGGTLPHRVMLRLGLLLSALRQPDYPYISGHVGTGYAVQFFFSASRPVVRKVYLTFYGRDWSVPGRACDRLIANTGWILKT